MCCWPSDCCSPQLIESLLDFLRAPGYKALRDPLAGMPSYNFNTVGFVENCPQQPRDHAQQDHDQAQQNVGQAHGFSSVTTTVPPASELMACTAPFHSVST